MTNKCVVCGCRGKPGDGLSFHRFPDNEDRKSIWLKALKIKHAGKWHYVCSDHFNKGDYIIKGSGQRVLTPAAIPFLPSSSPSHDASSIVASSSNVPIPLSPQINKPTTSMDSKDISLDDDTSRTETISEVSEQTLTASEASTLTASDVSGSLRKISSSTSSGSPKRKCVSASPLSSSCNRTSSPIETTNEPSNVQASSELQPPKKRRKLTHKRYVGDISSSELASPKKAKEAFNLAKSKVIDYRRKIDLLQRQNRRMKARVNTLKSLLILLKKKNLISETALESIEASLPGPAAEMVKRILKGSRREEYSPVLRAFALTLHFYSPRAYMYVREKFNKSLPHPSTVSKWYQNIDGSPGFTKESLNAIKNKVYENQEKGKSTFVNLVMDEMSIRKKIEWVGDKFVGFVDIGANVDQDSLPEAKEVLVFLVTCVNGNWKIPVGYFCLDGLSGGERANLVRQCLEFLYESRAIVTSLTFDGAASNIAMAKQLGADFNDPNNIISYFKHPVTMDKVSIFFDICHMIKLVRNCLGDFKQLKTKHEKVVSWDFLTELVNLQINEGLYAGSKIKKRHLQYAREKMRVKIATQTFSKSVSDALLFLEEDLKIDSFKGAGETAKFCLLFNDVFDILNSRNKYSTYLYKKALSKETESCFLKRFGELKEYILGLNLNGTPILKGPRKTGFLGFLVGMQSFIDIYKTHVKAVAPKLNFLLGYKFSQDHLEIFFSSVRSQHGFNNNPTCRQFQSAYKKLLISREVRGADTGNATILDNTLILNVSSRKITLNDDQEDMENSDDYHKLCQELDNLDFFSTNGWQLSSFLNDVIIYIAGFVVKSLKKCITCNKCLALLESNETASLLQKRKTFGNLVKASSFVSEICTWGERIFRQMGERIFSPKFKNTILNIIIHKTIAVLPQKIFEYCGDHLLDGDLLDNHQLSLIKLILKRYFTLRMHHETRKMSDEVKNRVRSVLTHLILYQNQ